MKPIIVAGLPGVGKSRFTSWLLSKGWTVLEGDVADTWDRDVHDAWDAALAGSDSALEAYADKQAVGLVIEWGFLRDNLSTVQEMVERGYPFWFLDGDRDAAFVQWQEVHPDDDPACFEVQVEGLAEINQEISDLFGARRLWILEADRTGPQGAEIATIVVPWFRP